MNYFEKLKDPRWQKLRLQVMERDKFTCLCCGATEDTLNVHHLQYNDNPWDTPIEMLETLCEQCHEQREDFQKEFVRVMRSIKTVTFLKDGGGRLIANSIALASGNSEDEVIRKILQTTAMLAFENDATRLHR